VCGPCWVMGRGSQWLLVWLLVGLCCSVVIESGFQWLYRVCLKWVWEVGLGQSQGVLSHLLGWVGMSPSGCELPCMCAYMFVWGIVSWEWA